MHPNVSMLSCRIMQLPQQKWFMHGSFAPSVHGERACLGKCKYAHNHIILLRRVGTAFRATESEVSFRYSTQTCGEFYANHGRIERQLCGHPLEALSNVDERGPADTVLDCS